jgi:LuxR family transcriptional regulator, maltose regulon positive regulatory protein
MVPPRWVSRHRAILVIRGRRAVPADPCLAMCSLRAAKGRMGVTAYAQPKGMTMSPDPDAVRSVAADAAMVLLDQLPATAGAPVPAAGGGTISRRALFDRLARAGRVTQVSAPAGSGKTFLLRSWIGAAGLAGSTAWVSVPRQERNPQRFWVSVVNGLQQTAAGSAVVRPLTAAPDLDGWAVVEGLLKDLESLRERAWLVIDDVHELRSAEVQRQLELLLMRAPPELRCVLATRHDVRLGLHRLRLEGEVTEIRSAHLRFTLDEARALFRAAGVELPESALTLLHARTEGWAAGLRLAALSLAGHRDPEQFAAEFSGSERTVAEYLLAEVLERQSEEVRRLLLRTSILERVSGELADLLTGGSGAERILQDLEEAGAFVVSLDGHRSWFRYHRLFADLLQLELRHTEPGELPALHATAAGWFAGKGYPAEAIRHAQAARDWSLAARLLSDHWVDLDLGGQAATARELLAAFPAGVAAADAELTALSAAAELAQGSLEEAERQLALAIQRSASVPADRRGRLEVMLTVLRLSLARQRGDLPAVSEAADGLLAALDTPGDPRLSLGEDLRALTLISLGIAEVWAFRFKDASQHLEQGVALARWIRRPYLELTALAHEAELAALRSYTRGAERSKQAIDLARRHGWSDEAFVAVAYTVLGGAMVSQGRLAEGERWLGHAARTLRPDVEPAVGMHLHYARGGLEMARGRHADAIAAFLAAQRLAETLITPHTLATPMRAHMLQAFVLLGETGRAERSLAELDPRECEGGEMRNAIALLRLARGDPHGATAALAPVLDGSVRVHPVWVVAAALLEATALDELGDPAAAERALEHALDLAEPDLMLFPFLTHPVPALLERHVRDCARHTALVTEILSLLPAGHRCSGGTASPGARKDFSRSSPQLTVPSPRLAEPLSQGETRVLRYLPTNLSAPEIARELSVSVHTVRTHIRHVCGKLGAHGRTEAVTQARALGLLAPSPHAP